MNPTRRSLVSSLAFLFPFGLGARFSAAADAAAPVLRFRRFEEGVRAAFSTLSDKNSLGRPIRCRRVEVGYSEEVAAGLQGCHNDRPFAGFAAGHLRIVGTGSGPGLACGGVRLYVMTVDVALTGGLPLETTSRPLDFATLPPAPVLVSGRGVWDFSPSKLPAGSV